jgi:3-dehydroquinate dehydratase-2
MFNKFITMKVIIINGPNLNLLGKRNTSIYGDISFDDYFNNLKKKFNSIELEYYQSNVEGQLINKLQAIGFSYDYIILNAGGYTHSSVALADCVEAIDTPVIEVHISNIYSREEFRQNSLLAPFCQGCIIGLGLNGYSLALKNIINR